MHISEQWKSTDRIHSHEARLMESVCRALAGYRPCSKTPCQTKMYLVQNLKIKNQAQLLKMLNWGEGKNACIYIYIW